MLRREKKKKKNSEEVEEEFLEKMNLRGAAQLTLVFVQQLSEVFPVLHYLLEFVQTHVH